HVCLHVKELQPTFRLWRCRRRQRGIYYGYSLSGKLCFEIWASAVRIIEITLCTWPGSSAGESLVDSRREGINPSPTDKIGGAQKVNRSNISSGGGE
ncbi:MAG: hypothetical protein WBD28_02005, partial [Candidatus Zixiibacteriota bacterium]